jgi:hypothetical protein
VAGQDSSSWPFFYNESQGLVLVVVANDRSKTGESGNELYELLAHNDTQEMVPV